MIKKKKLLFLYYSYHEYSEKIINALEDLNFEVNSFSLTPKMNFFEKLINILTKDKYFNKKLIQKQKRFFSYLTENIYDYIFVLNCGRFDSDSLDYLKRKFSKLNPVFISAYTKENIEELKEKIKQNIK